MEFSHTGEKGDSKKEMRQFMEARGYVVHSEVSNPSNLANDFIFVQKKIMEQLQSQRRFPESDPPRE